MAEGGMCGLGVCGGSCMDGGVCVAGGEHVWLGGGGMHVQLASRQ